MALYDLSSFSLILFGQIHHILISKCMIWDDLLEARRGRKRERSEVSPFLVAIEWVSDPRFRRRARNPNKENAESESESDPHHLMSFSFFKPSRPKTPQEVVKAIRDSLMALDTKTVVEVKALEKVGSLFKRLLSDTILFMKVSTFTPDCWIWDMGFTNLVWFTLFFSIVYVKSDFFFFFYFQCLVS